MKGDFARVTFDPALHYSHVFQQQGRVVLEADWNEQAAIHLHLLRTLAVDLVGACWAAGEGFGITNPSSAASGNASSLSNWQLSPGHFYVDGILCENDAIHTLAQQPCAPTPDDGNNGAGSSFAAAILPCALWLDVWERHLSWIEAPPILDGALNGVDTCSRAQVVWQVRMLNQQQAGQLLTAIVNALKTRLTAPGLTSSESTFLKAESDVLQKLISDGATGLGLDQIAAAFTGNPDLPHGTCIGLRGLLNARRNLVPPRLSAQLPQPASDPDPCILAVDARYRGCENQLYRVEIHQGTAPVVGGNAATVLDPNGVPTFKWSRENGSVIFPIKAVVAPGAPGTDNDATMAVTLAAAGRDDRLGLAEGDWVELVDDDYTLAQCAFPLLQIATLDTTKRSLTLAVPNNTTPYVPNVSKHALLRRWDQRQTESVTLTTAGVIEVAENKAIDLEDGIQVTFQPGGLYATGDYWVIPARVANGGTLDWPPGPDGNPAMLPAKGVHHYAVLGSVNSDGYQECCCRVPSICSLLANPNNASRAGIAADAVATAPIVRAAVASPAQPAAAVVTPPTAVTPPAIAANRADPVAVPSPSPSPSPPPSTRAPSPPASPPPASPPPPPPARKRSAKGSTKPRTPT